MLRVVSKIVCIDSSKQKVLFKGQIYTVKSLDSLGRVYIEEWKRFSFSPARFEVVE